MNEYRWKLFNGCIYICGFMASGKSTIGKIVAEQLDKPFLDLDKVIEEKAGMSIPEIFDKKGEETFRELEWKCLLELSRTFKGILALGGGTLHNQQVVDHLKIHGLIVYIETPIDVVVERVRRNKKRPIVLDNSGEIKDKNTLLNELKTLYSARLPLYEQAHVKLSSTGEEEKTEQAQKMIDKLKRYA